MISVKLMGGLGNQLFQIYTLLAHSLKTGVAFSLKHHKMLYGRDVYWTNIFKNLTPFLHNDSIMTVVYREPEFKYHPIPKIDHGSIEGYFQSWRYFEDYKHIINQMLTIQQQREAVKVHDGVNVGDISIHFRVGDYKVLQECHPVMSKNYYRRALEQLIMDTQLDSGAKVTYFYERSDQDHVTEIINYLETCFGDQFIFQPIMEGLKDYEELLAMSLHQYNIIANSSFSWWAAYLNDHANKAVYYPSNWFGPKLAQHDTSDLCPDSWIMIK